MRRAERRHLLLLAFLLAGGLVLRMPARAEDAPAQAGDTPASQLQSVEKAIGENRSQLESQAQQAEALAVEISGLREKAVAAARAVQLHETALSGLEVKLVALSAQERTEHAELDRQRAKQARLLVALGRLASSPPEGLLLAPGSPVDVLRGAILMGAAVAPLEQRTHDLNTELASLGALRAEIAATKATQQTEATALAGEQTSLAALIERKAQLQLRATQGVEESRRRDQLLAARAKDLKDLIVRLDAEQRVRDAAERRENEHREAERRDAERRSAAQNPPQAGSNATTVSAPAPVILDPEKPKDIRPFAMARGAMAFPASGTILRRYGGTDELGQPSKGLTLETRPGAQVVAPFDGQVLFAGPFRGYGQILILGHRDGYHSLVAGLGRVNASVGQWLVAGEPVGLMPSDADKPRLYLELRHNNQPIDPLPWLTTHVEKVNG